MTDSSTTAAPHPGYGPGYESRGDRPDGQPRPDRLAPVVAMRSAAPRSWKTSVPNSHSTPDHRVRTPGRQTAIPSNTFP
jgi:hypothetical protein